MLSKQLIEDIKRSLSEHYGTRLRGVVLYGSEARGDAGPDSDIDLIVLLEGPVETWREIQVIVQLLYPLQLESEIYRPLAAIPVDVEDYEGRATALCRSAARDGHLL
jgi:predicted nucleotidyltransferase